MAVTQGFCSGHGATATPADPDGSLRQPHYWGRRFQGPGHAVRLILARDVRPHVRRNKTDRHDVAGMLEADRCADIAQVPVKTPEQQGIQSFHRLREHLKVERTATINLLRGTLREFGIIVPLGAAKLSLSVREALEDGDNELPMATQHHGQGFDPYHVSRRLVPV